MNNLFDSFQPVNLEQWSNQLVKDLKGQSEELLNRVDAIEGFAFTTYQHQENVQAQPVIAWEDKYSRGLQRESNFFYNVKNIIVETASEANKSALFALNNGANSLRFENISNIDLVQLFANIQLDVIQVRLVEPSFDQVEWIVKTYSSLLGTAIIIEIDPLLNTKNIEHYFPLLKEKQFPLFCINAYGVQQVGATIIQEITFSLTLAHDVICQLLEKGMSIDEAAACVHFNIGIGPKYFHEIAKVRTLRMLWTRIIEEYTPKSQCSKNILIFGLTGFINKSLKDPHTNLLRQTTEVASLIIGGCNALCCQAHDFYNGNEQSVLAARMALNIPNVLLEESYFDKVIDPYAGSYAVEAICNTIADKSWKAFSILNDNGGLLDNQKEIKEFTAQLLSVQEQRIQAYKEGTIKMIGINTFSNPENISANWKSTGSYLGIENLVYERIEEIK